jgi:hypothetical protein
MARIERLDKGVGTPDDIIPSILTWTI